MIAQRKWFKISMCHTIPLGELTHADGREREGKQRVSTVAEQRVPIFFGVDVVFFCNGHA